MAALLFLDNTVLCNFAAVDRLDLVGAAPARPREVDRGGSSRVVMTARR